MFENAVNRAVIMGFLMEKRVCNTTIYDTTFIACKYDIFIDCKYDIYKRRRIFGKMSRFCYSLIERKLSV